MQKELQTYVDELFTDISPTAKSEAVKNELLQRMQNKYDQYVKTGMGEETAYKKVVDSVEEISELDIDLNQIQFSVNHEHERDEIYSQKEYKSQRRSVLLFLGIGLYLLSIAAAVAIPSVGGVLLMILVAAIATSLVVLSLTIFNDKKKPTVNDKIQENQNNNRT